MYVCMYARLPATLGKLRVITPTKYKYKHQGFTILLLATNTAHLQREKNNNNKKEKKKKGSELGEQAVYS
jgi:hypothetical protein